MINFQQFMQNPMGLLLQRFNIPQNVTDPQQIIQNLLNTGQISQDQLNRAVQTSKAMGFK